MWESREDKWTRCNAGPFPSLFLKGANSVFYKGGGYHKKRCVFACMRSRAGKCEQKASAKDKILKKKMYLTRLK